ncbi:hypothetical protein F5Y09DRAFT_356106 [Xylaria sp. FL1042]|nr:hypothetical protein F5Y09DRAFT_356106 [Xylaria sp. FL1042]
MADPLSVAGLVTGVISLGLQVASGLSDYLDAVKGRTEELGSAKRQAIEMKDLLLTIKDLLPRVESSFPESATMIQRHVESCDAELSALHALLSELSQPTSSSSGIRLKLSEQKKKLTYPFNRSHISRLEERLAKVNNMLQTALKVAVLDVSMASASQIRQVHDLVISMSRLSAARVQSASFVATLQSPEQAVHGGPVIPLDSIESAISLASKPSLLSSSMETLERCNTIQTPRGKWSLVCSCPSSRNTSYQRSSWGSFSFSYGTSTTRRHLPDCPLSQIDTERRATKFTLEYTGLSKLIQTAFAFSLFNTQGAGGRSISPDFTYYPTIDEKSAPAFRILTLANKIFYHAHLWKEKEVAIMLQCCFSGVFTLYSQKKASPRDISSNGQSLMHLAAGIVDQAQPYLGDDFVTGVLFPIMTNFIACGVPVTTYDDHGLDLAKLLLPVEPDIPLVRVKELHDRKYPFLSILAMLLLDPKLAEASGCGPLSLAARAGDDKLVQDLLKRSSQFLEELNQFGQGPLHFAIKHPLCLRLILETGGLSMLDSTDYYGGTPLHYACGLGCGVSIQILVASGSRVRSLYLEDADESVIDDVLAALKQRREELKMLALENLTTTEAKSLGLHENRVLDGNALEVQALLLKRGVDVPSRLYVDVLLRLYVDEDDQDRYSSVYLISCYPEDTVIMFEKLWALGFRDVDTYGGWEEVPLSWHRDEVEAVRWLMEHGADYWTPFSERSDRSAKAIPAPVTPAHFLSSYFGFQLCWELRRKITSTNAHSDTDSETGSETGSETRQCKVWIVEKWMQVRVSDTCTCPCSPGGCTPLKAFFDRRGWTHERDPQQLAQCMSSLQTFLISFNREHLIAVLRRVTFDALGLTHACCDFGTELDEYEASVPTPEEADEINSEQNTLVTLFTNLFTELDRVAHEDQGGVPLIVHDPEEFWMRRWLPRITETLDGLDGDDLTKEERSAAEAIGVVWGPRPAEVVQEVPDYLPQGTPEYVMMKLEQIMNE